MDQVLKKKILIGIVGTAGVLLFAALGLFVYFMSLFSTYKDKTNGFSIKYPRAWEVRVAPQQDVAVVFVSPLETALDVFRENANITIQDVQPDLASLKNFSDKILLQMKAVFENITVLESGPEDFGGRKGYRSLFYAENPDRMHILNVWTIKGGSKAYIFTFMSAGGRYERHSALIEEMIRSFKVQ